MSDLTPIDASITQAGAPVTAAGLRVALVENIAALYEATYGARDPREVGAVYPHDHAQGGGEVLGVALFSISLGPYRDGAGVQHAGVPLLPAAAGVDLAARHKLLASAGVYLPAGVASLRLGVLCLPGYAGTETVHLAAVIRPISDLNANEIGSTTTDGAGVGHIARSVATLDGADPWGVVDLDFDDLSLLGPETTGRLCEVALFQVAGQSTGKKIHVCSLTARALTTAGPREVRPGDAADPSLALYEIAPGTALTEELTARLAQTQDGAALALLGGVPGRQGGAVDTRRPWRQDLQPHQHQGSTLLDGDGLLYSDGARLPRTVFALSWTEDLGDDATPAVATVDARRGLALHPTGNAANSLRTVKCLVSLPKGARDLRLRLAIQPAESGALYSLALFAHLGEREQTADVDDPTNLTNLITAIDGRTTTDSEIDSGSATGYRARRLVPDDCGGYSPAQDGIGSWGAGARVAQDDAPPGVVVVNSARISREIRLSLASHETGDFMLRLALCAYLDSGEAHQDVSGGAALAWVVGYDAGEDGG